MLFDWCPNTHSAEVYQSNKAGTHCTGVLKWHCYALLPRMPAGVVTLQSAFCVSVHANTLPSPKSASPSDVFLLFEQTLDRTSNHHETMLGVQQLNSSVGFPGHSNSAIQKIGAKGIGRPSSCCGSYCMWRAEAAIRHGCLQLFVLAVLLAGCAANPQGAWLPNQGAGLEPQPFCTQ